MSLFNLCDTRPKVCCAWQRSRARPPALCGGDAVWLWCGVFDRLWHESSCVAPSLVWAVRRAVREPGTAARVPRGQMVSGHCLADTERVEHGLLRGAG